MRRTSASRATCSRTPAWPAVSASAGRTCRGHCGSRSSTCRQRLKDLWSMLDSQMGALMRAGVERQGIGLMEAVERHRVLLEAVDSGDVDRLRLAIRDHYLEGFPEHEAELGKRRASAPA